jgi:hypothetical protein
MALDSIRFYGVGVEKGSRKLEIEVFAVVLITHLPLPAIHLLPTIHVRLHFLLAIDPDLLPMI